MKILSILLILSNLLPGSSSATGGWALSRMVHRAYPIRTTLVDKPPVAPDVDRQAACGTRARRRLNLCHGNLDRLALD